jgi:hypothetical protein
MRTTSRWLRRAAAPAAPAGMAALLGLLGMPAAAAATALAPKPAMLTLRTSKAHLASGGGVITVTATVRDATKCTFSSRPPWAGFRRRCRAATAAAEPPGR